MNMKNEFIESTAYAGWILDDEIRYNSSSGGIFTSLANIVLKEGGIVYGVAYDKNLNAYHLRIDNVEQLYMIRGSKYIQSEIKNAYRDAINDLKSGRRVLFSGTPCQTAAINNIVKNTSFKERLLTIDLLCHGVASPLAWEYYLQEICQKEKSTVVTANMRDKTYGWYEGCVKLTMKNGLEYKEHYRNNGIWGPSFITNLFLRDSCYNCHFKKKVRKADITLGDFWSATREDDLRKYDDHDKGTSVILVNSLKGEEYVKKLTDCHIEEIPYECLLKGTYVLYKSSGRNYFSRWAFKSLGDIPFSQIIEKTTHPSVIKRVQRKLWNIFYRNNVGKKEGIHIEHEKNSVDNTKAGSKIPQLYDAKEECCGCNACYSVCNSHAITMCPDEKGFLYPKIDTNKCSRCYSCLRVCPIKTVDLENSN